MGVTAVLMVGGPTKGTRFRPLSLTAAKPLFPLAGKPMVEHPVLACKRIPELIQVCLIGYYEAEEIRAGLDLARLSRELQVPVTYLQEDASHGSAGGLYYFRETLERGKPEHLIVLNCDVCSDFPLQQLLVKHVSHGQVATVMTKKLPSDIAVGHGAVVADEASGRIIHYAERTATAVSSGVETNKFTGKEFNSTDVVCGVYVFSCDKIFGVIRDVAERQQQQGGKRKPGFQIGGGADDAGAVTVTSPGKKSLDMTSVVQGGPVIGVPEVFKHLVSEGAIFSYSTTGFWEVLKTPGMALKFSELYLGGSEETSRLAKAHARLNGGPDIAGNVYIHPNATVHPTAKVGPNVAVEADAIIGPGVRLVDCIVLDGVHIQENAVVSNAIVGWNSHIGAWSRVQGSGDYVAKFGVAILGEGTIVGSELVVTSSVVMPHKEIAENVAMDIIL